MSDGPAGVAVFKAPDNPDEKAAWARAMLRIQVAMWVDEGAACAHCKKAFASVDDFLARNPRSGYREHPGEPMTFVDDACWGAYQGAWFSG